MVGGIDVQGRKHVAVEIHRDRDSGVAEDLHHDPRVDVLSEQQAGAGVPKIVEALGRKISVAAEGCESPCEVSWLDR